jgi:hypothetical protein
VLHSLSWGLVALQRWKNKRIKKDEATETADVIWESMLSFKAEIKNKGKKGRMLNPL